LLDDNDDDNDDDDDDVGGDIQEYYMTIGLVFEDERKLPYFCFTITPRK